MLHIRSSGLLANPCRFTNSVIGRVWLVALALVLMTACKQPAILPPSFSDSAISNSAVAPASSGAVVPTPFPSFPLPTEEPLPSIPGVVRGIVPAPLPLSPVWNPPGPKRVGLQVGHWQIDEPPEELRNLSAGAAAGGWDEWEVNLLVAQHAQALLEAAGIQVDLLPAVIPIRYRAHAFITIHADGDWDSSLNGYKVARSTISSIPQTDDTLVGILAGAYAAATELEPDEPGRVSGAMTDYYAFNTRRFHHAIDVGTPAAIVELGYLTNPADRAFLTGQPERAARGIVDGLLQFLAAEIGSTTP